MAWIYLTAPRLTEGGLVCLSSSAPASIRQSYLELYDSNCVECYLREMERKKTIAYTYPHFALLRFSVGSSPEHFETVSSS